jgi:hypothetical protein
MMKKDKRDFLVATESSVFQGGDGDVVLPDDIAAYMESESTKPVNLPQGSAKGHKAAEGSPTPEWGGQPTAGAKDRPDIPGLVDVPMDSDEAAESEPLVGRKAALFGSVEPSREDRATFDWLKMEGVGGKQVKAASDELPDLAVDDDSILIDEDDDSILIDDDDEATLEGDELLEALQVESRDALPTKADADARKKALFSSVEPSDQVKANFGFERREGAVTSSAQQKMPAKPAAAPVAPAKQARPASERSTDMNKIATDVSAESSVFGSAGGHVVSGKASKDLAKRLKALNEEQIVGLDLWEDGATACFVKYARGKILITHAGQVEFSKDGGDAERATQLKALWRGMKLPTRSVWVNVHNASLLQKYVRYDVPMDDLVPYLRRDAEESMSGAGGSVVLDWVMTPQPGGGGEGILFALPAWEQDHLLGLLKKAGLYVCGLSVAACDLARLYTLMRPATGEGNAQCICSLSRTGADIVIVYGDGALYSRTVYSRSGGWDENLSYLYECLNDAINYFNSWINKSPVSSVMLCGHVPEVGDLVGELLQETGLLGEVWNPVLGGGLFELAGLAKKNGISGRVLAGSLGLALERG